MKNVAIIILNYNTWQATLEEANRIEELFDISKQCFYIIDNASTNDSYQQLKNHCPIEYNLILAKKNGGYASGNNIGLKRALQDGYKYAWIINNDIVLDNPRLLNRMLQVLEQEPKVATVNPDIYASDGHLYNRESIRPNVWDLTFGMFHYRSKGRRLEEQSGYGIVYRPQGCCMLVSLEKMQQVDFFDENTFLYGEELILAERLRIKNYNSVCCSDISVVHENSKTVKSIFDKKQILQMKWKSFEYYLKKYRKFSKGKCIWISFFYKLKLCLLEL